MRACVSSTCAYKGLLPLAGEGLLIPLPQAASASAAAKRAAQGMAGKGAPTGQGAAPPCSHSGHMHAATVGHPQQLALGAEHSLMQLLGAVFERAAAKEPVCCVPRGGPLSLPPGPRQGAAAWPLSPPL